MAGSCSPSRRESKRRARLGPRHWRGGPVPLREEPAQALAFSPDGSLLALARGNEIEVWDTADWRLRRRLAAHAQSVEALAFAPNGRLASGSDDRSIRLWDAAQGRELLTLRGHLGGVTSPGVHSRQPTARLRRQGTDRQGLGRDPSARGARVPGYDHRDAR